MTDVLKLKAGEFFDSEDKRKVLTYVFFGVGERKEGEGIIPSPSA